MKKSHFHNLNSKEIYWRRSLCEMAKTKNTNGRNAVLSGIGIGTGATATCLLSLLVLTSNSMTTLKVAEAFVIPSGINDGKKLDRNLASSLNYLSEPTKKDSMIIHPRASPRLYSTQFEEQQQVKPDQELDSENKNISENDVAKRLLLDAERLRLEAEQMDAALTLQKISLLEEKLSNDSWLKKQKGQTVKDLYEELRMLERKVSRPNSTVSNKGDCISESEEVPSSASLSSSSTTSSSPTSPRKDYSSSNARFNNDEQRTNPNLPPIAGFDDKDLNLYVPVAEDITRMVPNATLDERIGLFRDAPELQAHFKEKIESLLLGPLEEMQELEYLKQQFFASSSSREKDALLKQIKRIEAKMEENNIGVNNNGGGGDRSVVNDPGGIGYSKSILISSEKLPPLSQIELEERYEAIKALPDILVAVYLQRSGLYNLPVEFATIKVDVGKDGIGINMDTANNSATETDSKLEVDDDKSNGNNGSSFDLFENLKLAIQMDYYDLQLQLLSQALEISQLSDDFRNDYTAALRSLPLQVRERYVIDNLGIDTVEANVITSGDEKDIKRLVEEILRPINEKSSLGTFMNLNGKNNGVSERPIEPPEYNDVEFIDRSRYLEEFFPSVALLEGNLPYPEDVELFVKDCLTGKGTKSFMVTSKPERVMGGYYVRGRNQLGIDESNSTTANDRLVQEVYRRLQNHPTLQDKIEFYYILDPSPPTDEEMELVINLNPLFLITGKDFKTMYRLPSPMIKAAVTFSGLISTFLFSAGSCVLNPEINASIQQTLDNLSASGSTMSLSDVQWFYDLCLPLYFSFLGILFAHELGHRAVASYYKFDIGVPNVVPSVSTGLGGAITPLKSPPPNNKALFDFALAGPLCGLVVSIGLLIVGLEITRETGLDTSLPIFPVDLARASSLGGGMIQYFLGKYALVPNQDPAAFVALHPFALSGWIGCIINALALLPLGHTDGGRISLAMFGRRGAFVIKLFTLFLIIFAGLIGMDDMSIFLPYAIFVAIYQRDLESPIRNEVDELDFSRGFLGISSAILVGLILIPMTA